MTKYSHTWAYDGDISHSRHCSLCGGRPNFYLNEHPEWSAIMRTINLIAQLLSLQDLLTNMSWFLLYANPFPGAQGQSCKSQVVLRTHALAIPSQGLTVMPYHCYLFLFSLEYLRKGERGSWFSARCGWYWQFTNGHLLQGSASFLTFSAFLSVYSWFFGLSSHGLSHLLNF